MRILISGGAGFIGSHIVDAYLLAGHDIAVLDSLCTGRRDQVHSDAQCYEVDIRDVTRVKQIVKAFRPDILNHHAAQLSVSASVADPRFDADVNIVGFLSLMEAVRPYVSRVLVASSGGAIYGDTKSIPTPDSEVAIPMSPYGIAKFTMEQYLGYYATQYAINWVALRYANVYGPRQHSRSETGVISVFLDRLVRGEQPRIFGDGRQTRDYVFIEDVVAANLSALTRGNGAYNIGTGIETTVLELCAEIQGILGSDIGALRSRARPGEQRRSALNSARAKEELLWQPTTLLADGLRKTVAWHQQQTLVEQLA